MRFVKSLILSLLFVAGLAQASPTIQHWTTGNGARVYYIPAPQLPMVDLRVVFDAGSARDGQTPGLAMMANGLLDAGIQGMDEDAIAEKFEDLGANFSSMSMRDMALVQLRSLTQDKLLAPAMSTFIKVLSAPEYPDKVIKRERARMLLALKAKQESPGDLADDAFYAALYPQHPYGTPPDGTKTSLESIDRKMLVDFHRRYYVASNAVVAIVGAVDRKQAEDMAERISAALPKGEPAPALPAVAPLQQASTRHIDYPSSQTTILVGQPGMKRGDPDYLPLYVGNHILGGSGFSSRIVKEIRVKRGLSYSAYSYFVPMHQDGPFMMGLQTRNKKAAEAMKVLNQTLRRFVDQGPTSKELNAAKKNITGGFPLRIDSNKDLVEYAAMIGFYKLPLDYLDRFNSRVEKVTVKQIRAAFKRRVHPDKMVTIIVGPKP